MTIDPRVYSLLERWEAQRGQGQALTPEELCADSPDLLDEVRQRIGDLQALKPMIDTDAGGLSSALPYPDSPSTATAVPPASGTRYQPLRFHAKGGLGEVHVAADAELNREVALKRIQAHRAHDPESRRRFLREAEITGRLEHPGVVPVHGLVHDADGEPCYAMRFIQGETLHDAIGHFHKADKAGRDMGERRLEFRQLLNRFVAVCNTVAYAHSRGVLHRDLKPSNVMLGKYGETLVVDWGLAKPFARTGEERTGGKDSDTPEMPARDGSDTAMGQAMGTPAYMSPEQAAGRWKDVGPASDIYSLGATLYAVLTGKPPYEGFWEQDRVQEGKITPPRQVKRDVPRALEAVCLKAMALRPEDRYASAAALAADVEHWLADEPAAAYREPLMARLGRWGRRHRPIVAGAAALLVTAVAALAVSTFLIRREQRETAAQKVRADANFAIAKKAIEDYVAKVAENKKLQQADFESLRKELLAAAVPIYEQLAQVQGDDVALQADRGRAYKRLADLSRELGNTRPAEQAYEEALRIFRKLAELDPAQWEYQQELASTYNNLGNLHSDSGNTELAAKAYERSRDLHQHLSEVQPENPHHNFNLAKSECNLGLLYKDQGKTEDAIRKMEQARTLLRNLTEQHPQDLDYQSYLATALANLGALYYVTKRLDQAEAPYQEALAIRKRLLREHLQELEYQSELAGSYNNLALLFATQGRTDPAESMYREALALQQRLADDHPRILDHQLQLARSHLNLGDLYTNAGRAGPAEQAFLRGNTILQHQAAANPEAVEIAHDLVASWLNLGEIYRVTGRAGLAADAYKEARTLADSLIQKHPELVELAIFLGGAESGTATVLRDTGKFQEALPWYGKAIRRLEAVLEKQSESLDARKLLTEAYCRRALALAKLSQRAEAEGDLKQARELDKGQGYREVRLCQAQLLAATGNHAQATAEAAEFAKDEKLFPRDWYDLACVYSLAAAAAAKDDAVTPAERSQLAERHAGRAIESLRKAQAAGYFADPALAQQLKRDTDLKALQAREDFQNLAADLERKK